MQRKLVSKGARRCLLALLAASPARAAEAPHPPIVLVLDPCAAVDAEQVRRLVPIEMGAPLVAGAGDPGGTTRVFVGCVAGSPGLVHLEVRDAGNGRRVDRVITLVGDSKTDQARLVAIVAVELVAASRGEAEPEPVAPSVVVAPPAPEALVVTATPAAAPSVARAQWRALALGSLRHVAGLPRLLPGGGLALERAWPRGFALGVDAVAEGAAEPTALGDVDALLLSASVVGAWRVERGRFAWEAGLGARGGEAWLSGRAASGAQVKPGSVSAPWAGPLVAARAQAVLASRVVVTLGGELGVVTSAVAGHVEGRPDVAVSGAWWNLVLGVGLGL